MSEAGKHSNKLAQGLGFTPVDITQEIVESADHYLLASLGDQVDGEPNEERASERRTLCRASKGMPLAPAGRARSTRMGARRHLVSRLGTDRGPFRASPIHCVTGVGLSPSRRVPRQHTAIPSTDLARYTLAHEHHRLSAPRAQSTSGVRRVNGAVEMPFRM
jgi:hypothetical protein